MEPLRVVITGVSRGLGKALTLGIAARGHDVFGCARNAEALATLSEEVAERAKESGHDGQKIELRPADVSTGAVAEWAADVVSAYGAPDLLIANAGAIHRPAPLWELEVDAIERVVSTNVTGTLRTIRAFLPSMVREGRGVVALVSSGWGRSVAPEVATYCASKWAIEGLARALAQELPAGMASVAVNPGIIDTEMLREVWGDGAGSFPDAAAWSERAVSFFLGLSGSDNGQALTV